MKNITLLVLISATGVAAQKQKAEYYIYNKDWKPVKEVASADYIMRTTSIGDS